MDRSGGLDLTFRPASGVQANRHVAGRLRASQTMTTFHAMIVSARRKSLMDAAGIRDHLRERIGKQERRGEEERPVTGKVSQDRCFFSKSRVVRCPLNRNVGKVKPDLSLSSCLSSSFPSLYFSFSVSSLSLSAFHSLRCVLFSL